MQTRLQSAIEVATNTLTGLAGNWLITFAVLWASERYHWNSKLTTACTLVGLCTVWSLVRSYWLRRRFNRANVRKVVEVVPDKAGARVKIAQEPIARW